MVVSNISGIEQSLQALVLNLLLGDNDMKRSAFHIWPIPTESTSTAMAKFMTPELTRRWLQCAARLVNWTQYESDLCRILEFGLKIGKNAAGRAESDGSLERGAHENANAPSSSEALDTEGYRSMTNLRSAIRERFFRFG